MDRLEVAGWEPIACQRAFTNCCWIFRLLLANQRHAFILPRLDPLGGREAGLGLLPKTHFLGQA